MIIAECGQNHQGNMDLARYLIRLAKENRADLAKFQLYDADKLFGEGAPEKQAELSKEQAFMLFDYGKEIGIEVFFSVFDVERVKWCEEIGVKRYKIASRMARNVKLVKRVDKTNKPAFISSGPELLIYPLRWHFLYCVPEYPTPLYNLRLGLIDFDWDYDGLSDHTIGIDCAKIALARGATIVEKHFAIDHQTGVDAEWSMTPDELRELVRFSKVVKEAL